MSFLAHKLASLYRQLLRFVGSTEDGIRGAVAVEFVIIAPILALMLVCTLDLGMGIYRKMQVQNGAQAGAGYAVLHGFTASSIETAVTSATSFMGVSASPAPSEFCGCFEQRGQHRNLRVDVLGRFLARNLRHGFRARHLQHDVALSGRSEQLYVIGPVDGEDQMSMRRLCRDEHGATAVEFALTAPAFFAILLAVCEFGMVAWT